MAARNMTRSSTVALLIASLVSLSVSASAADCPSVGAIRWDAWYGADTGPSRAVEQSLGPAKWHHRLPTCARALNDNVVKIDCGSAQEMAVEIDQAKQAGLEYWAFDVYPEGDPMSGGLNAYLASPAKSKLNFAILSEFSKWQGRSGYRKVLTRYVNLMKDPSYEKVSDGRPLMFIAFINDAAMEKEFGGRSQTASAIGELRDMAKSAGLKNPYIVLLDGNVEKARGLIHDLGLESISAYSVADNSVKNGQYRQLADMAEAFWARASSAGLGVVPIAMAGWDRRPRVMKPVPWEAPPESSDQIEHFYNAPTPEELSAHVAAAMRWAKHSTSAHTVLIYAWNEFDEGGYIAPTVGAGTTRLDAVHKAVASVCSDR